MMNDSPLPPARRRGLPWIPLIILGLCIGGLTWVRLLPELERNIKGWITMAIMLLTVILLLLWFLLSRRFSGRTRLIGLALVVLGIVGWRNLVKIDGTLDGTGLPRLAWTWSKPEQPGMREIAVELAGASPEPSTDPRLAQAADVPQFLGPNRDGVITGVKLDGDWKTHPPKELWRQPIGGGWSAFAVVAGRAYTQEQRGEEELVTCYDLFTGKLVWAHADKARFYQWQGGEGPHATPTVHEGRVYSYGGTGLLNCLEAGTGKVVWQRPVLKENKLQNIEWGVSASPLLVDDKVVVTGGNPRGPVLFAYHRNTGEPAWQAGDDKATYASPILATLAGKRVIVSNNARALSFHDAADGSVLAEHAWGADNRPKASQPVIIGQDRVFVSGGYSMGCLLLQMEAGADGKLTAREVWSTLKMKTQFNSAALLNGHLYGLDDGRLACLDTATGERLWKEGRFASGQSLLAGDRVIIQNESGPVHLCAASPEGFQELGKINALSSKTWTHPVLAGRYLLVRNDREAVCYELPVLP